MPLSLPTGFAIAGPAFSPPPDPHPLLGPLSLSLSSHPPPPPLRLSPFPHKSVAFPKPWIGDLGHSRAPDPLPPRNVSSSCSQGPPGESLDPPNRSSPQERAGPSDGAAEHGIEDAPSGSSSARGAEPPVWDLQARHRRLQAVAAKMGDPFRGMMSKAGKKLQDYLDGYKNIQVKDRQSDRKPEWDWERWQEHFAEVQEQENLASVLKFQLDEAVANEDFREAARLKSALAAATVNDTVAEVMGKLKKAFEEERYREAAKIRDENAAGLVGWWVGRAEGENDPYGRIVHISPAHGRFIAKGYSARQLSSAAPGIPLFEVFVSKEGDAGYQQQAVYLQRDGGAAGDSLAGAAKPVNVNIVDVDTLVEGGKEVKQTPEAPSEDDKEKSKDSDLIDEGLNRILNFLKDRIPDVKLKVFRVIAPNAEDTIPKIVEQLLEEVVGRESEDEHDTKETNRNGEVELQLDKTLAEESKEPMEEDGKGTAVRLVLGGVLQSIADDRPPKVPIRVPARVEHRSRDSFLFHIEETGIQPQTTIPKELSTPWKVATVATQASADLMPPDVAKVLWNVEKVPVKVSKEMGEFLKLAVSQVQKRRGLFKCTSFQRIKVGESNADPLNGLYIGAFGPYTSELVQLRRKYGNWQDDNELGSSKESLDFFEYVEAVKLTGDLNVPAGQVTFRAKTGRESRLSHRGIYPEELGVIARYKGQGRLAEPGFRNPQWIDGELVLMDGKGGGQTNGADLGFVYSVPERHFLVLFNRLKLQD